MSKFSDLKAAVGTVAGSGPWEAAHPNAGARGWEVKMGVGQIAKDLTCAHANYIAAASPYIVIRLIHRIEKLTAERNALRQKLEIDDDGIPL